MSEQQLKEFGALAESLVDVPDFAGLDQRGRNLRVRRRAGVAAALAGVLAVTGTALWTQRDSAKDEPITPPKHVVRPYPEESSKLREGTYRIRPSLIESDLTVEVTVPSGWNAWVGPQSGNDVWYVNALVLEVDAVNTNGCGNPWNHLTTTQGVVRALQHAFSTKVLSPPEQTVKFGYPATYLRLQDTAEIEDCPADNSSIFHTTRNGFIPYGGAGWILDIWVLDVEGTPIYVQKIWSPNAPRSARSELNAVVDSIKITAGK
jgi:hypothetical protein